MSEIKQEHREAARLLLNKLDGHHSVKEELTIAAEFIANLEARVRQEAQSALAEKVLRAVEIQGLDARFSGHHQDGSAMIQHQIIVALRALFEKEGIELS